MATEKKRIGRPPGGTLYPNKEKIKDALVSWISEGKTLREFCRQDNVPVFGVMYDWEAADEGFAKRIAHARIIGHNAIAEESLAIMDEEPLAVFDEVGNKRYDPGSIAWNKARVETRLKLLAKWNPRLYGDKTVIAGDADAPLVVAHAEADTYLAAILKNTELKKQVAASE